MATENFTGDGQQKTFEQLLCSAGLIDKLSGQLTFISVFNSFLSVTAFLMNALILIALYKESSLHTPSKLLLRCLATTDVCVGLISGPLYVIWLISALSEHWNMCRYISVAVSITSNILCGVTGDSKWNTRGQTSRPVVGTEIQTSCNFNPGLCSRCYLLVCVHCFFSNVRLEPPYNILVWHHRYTTVCYYLVLLLHKDFSHPPSSPQSS